MYVYRQIELGFKPKECATSHSTSGLFSNSYIRAHQTPHLTFNLHLSFVFNSSSFISYIFSILIPISNLTPPPPHFIVKITILPTQNEFAVSLRAYFFINKHFQFKYAVDGQIYVSPLSYFSREISVL